MTLVCLPSDTLLQHLPSYLGFSYVGRGVSLHGCSSKAQSLLITLNEGYLLTAAVPDLQRGMAPLGPPLPAQPLLLGLLLPEVTHISPGNLESSLCFIQLSITRDVKVKASACNAGDLGLIPGSGRSPGEGNGNPLQYSCLENPMDGGTWWASVHGVTKSRT